MSPKELRRFGFTLAVPLALLAVVGLWRGHLVLPAILGGLAAALCGLALLSPGLLSAVHAIWMKFADALAWFNTRVLLGLVYFLVMTPTGALMRLLGKDPLDRRLGDRPSYWIQRQRQPDPKNTMERRF